MNKRFTLALCYFFLISTPILAQSFAPFDCDIAIPVCSNDTLNYNTFGSGIDDFANPDNGNGCLLFDEHQSAWLKIQIAASTPPNSTLGFILSPIDTGLVDYDFSVYGPDLGCDSLGLPIRCSYAAFGGSCTFCPQTGLGNGAIDFSEGSGGDGFVSDLIVQPGEIYYILIDNFTSDSSGFALNWTGSATLDCDILCQPDAGSWSATNPGGNQTTNYPIPASNPKHFILCEGDGFDLHSNNDFSLPLPLPGEASAFMWAVYTSQPPLNPNPVDAQFTGTLIPSLQITDINFNGLNAFVLNNALTNNTVWFVPVTGDDGIGNGNPNGMIAIDQNGDSCFAYGNPVAVTYLNRIRWSVNDLCTGAEITITGGYPEFFGSTYSLSNLVPPSASFTTTSPASGVPFLITGLDSGDVYAYTISDPNGCSLTVMDTFRYSGLTDAIATNNSPACLGDLATLSGTTTTSGADTLYNWTGPNGFTSSLSNPTVSDPGYYYLVVTVGGCPSLPDSTLVSFLPSPILNPIPDQHVCSATFDLGSIAFTGTSLGAATFQFYTDSAGLPDSLTGPVITSNGLYWVEATVGSCSDLESVYVEFVDINLAFAPTPASCANSCDGAVNVTVTGSSCLPLSFAWSNGSTVEDPSGLCRGPHTVTVTDTCGCSATATVQITSPKVFVLDSAQINRPTCPGGNDGKATAWVSGGSSLITYAWSNGSTGQTATGLSGGIVSVFVTDGTGCRDTFDIFIPSPPPITVIDSITPSGCGLSNGSIQLTVTGGTGPYTYDWQHDPGLNAATAVNLAAGLYPVQITDANGCTTTASYSLNDSGVISVWVNSLGPDNCSTSQGSINLGVSGGIAPYSYNWSHNPALNSPTATGLPAGNYTVCVSDSNNCTNCLVIALPGTQPPVLTLDSIRPANCSVAADGFASVSASGGLPPYTFLWAHDGSSGISASGLAPGSYTVTVYDSLGCQNELTIIINNLMNSPVVSLSQGLPTDCNTSDGTLTANLTGGSGPFNLSWSHDPGLSGNFASGLGLGIYSLTVTDANGCIGGDTAVIYCLNQIPDTLCDPMIILDPQAVDVTDETCGQGNGSITITLPDSGLIYVWLGDSTINDTTLINLNSGNYGVIVIDTASGLCMVDPTINVGDSPGAILTAANVTPESCGHEDGALSVTASGGNGPLTYSWHHDSTLTGTSLTNLAAGSYTVTATDTAGCESELTVTVDNSGGPEILIDQLINENCGKGNGQIAISIREDFVYRINCGGPAYTSVAGLRFEADAFFSGGNASPNGQSYSGTPDPLLFQSNRGSNASFGYAFPVPNGNYTLNLYFAEPVFTAPGMRVFDVQAEGMPVLSGFDIFATAGSLTATSLSFTVNVMDGVLNVTFSGVTGNAIVAAIEAYRSSYNGFSIMWAHDPGLSGPVATGLSAGSYSISVDGGNGCMSTLDTILTDIPAPVLQLDSLAHTRCGDTNGMISLSTTGGAPPITYQWSHNPGLNNSTATNLAPGAYTVIVQDTAMCADTAAYDIDPSPVLVLNVTDTVLTSCQADDGMITVLVSGSTGAISYAWSHNATLDSAIAAGLGVGSYSVIATDSLGCQDSATVPVGYKNFPTTTTDSDDETCSLSNGTATVNVNGGTSPYTFLWAHDSTLNVNSLSGLPAGTYDVVMTDGDLCKITHSFTLNNLDPVLILTGYTPSLCETDSGNASVLVTGGLSPYTYSWSHNPALNGQAVTGLDSGTFTVMIMDQNNCEDTVSFTINRFADPVIAVQTVDPEICNQSNGTISLSVSNGNGPISYTWSFPGAPDSPNVSGLSMGNYSVTVTDSLGCTDAEAMSVGFIAGPTAAIDSFSVATCGLSNAKASVSASGGTPGYSYSWDNGQLSASATSLNAGTHTVTVTDTNGCTFDLPVVINTYSGAKLIPTAIQHENCGTSDGAISLDTIYPAAYRINCNGPAHTCGDGTVFGGDIYYSGGSAQFTNVPIAGTDDDILYKSYRTCNFSYNLPLKSGNYIVRLHFVEHTYNAVNQRLFDVAAEGVTVLSGFDIWANGGRRIAVIRDIPVTVTDDMLNLTFTNGPNCASLAAIEVLYPITNLSWSWFPNSGTTGSAASNLSSGNYFVSITDDSGCTDDRVIILEDRLGPDLALVSLDSSSCGHADGILEVEGSPDQAVEFRVNCGGPSFTTGGGTYFLPDLYYTGGSATFISAGFANTTDDPLFQGQRQGNFSYHFPVPDGNYTITLYFGDNAASPGSRNFHVDIEQQTVLNNYDIVGDVGSLTATTYTFTTDVMDDTLDIEIVGTNSSARLAAIEAVTTAPLFTYSWSNGGSGPIQTGLLPGTYIVTMTDPNSCPVADTFEMADYAYPQNELFAPVHPALCVGDSGRISGEILDGRAPFTLQWSDGSVTQSMSGLSQGFFTIPNLSADTFYVTITDQNGCMDQDTTELIDPTIPLVTFNAVVQPDCNQANGQVCLGVSYGAFPYTYSWSNGLGNVTCLDSVPIGIYSVQVTDKNGCEGTAIVNLAQNQVNLSLDNFTDMGCSGDTVGAGSIQASCPNCSGITSWFWPHDSTVTGPVATNLFPGNYLVMVTDAFNCHDTMQVTILDTCGTLPLSLMNFQAEKRGLDGLLQWQTASEIQLSHFEVEVANESDAQAGFFRSIGQLQAKGGGQWVESYGFTDTESGKSGWRYYRLKMVDLDGSWEYSELRRLDFGSGEAVFVGSVYPNPFDTEFNIQIESGSATSARILLVNMLGQKVLEEQRTLTAGNQILRITPGERIATGPYELIIQLPGRQERFKVIRE